RKWPNDLAKVRSLSIIGEEGGKRVRMAHLSVLASHSVNGVAELHTRLLKEKLFPEFNELYPGKFLNITNGITPRRWLQVCNPQLTALINSAIGDEWTHDISHLRKLEAFAENPDFQQRFRAVKRLHKEK